MMPAPSLRARPGSQCVGIIVFHHRDPWQFGLN